MTLVFGGLMVVISVASCGSTAKPRAQLDSLPQNGGDYAGYALRGQAAGSGTDQFTVNRRAIPLGHGIRTGLEDTPVLPDGRTCVGNGDLVAAAAALFV